MNRILLRLVQKVIIKYNPTIIGIVGDSERAVVRQSVYFTLENKYKGQVRQTPPNEEENASVLLGTILGLPIKFTTTQAISKATKLLAMKQNYPKYLVMEYPVNAVGKMDEFLKIIQPKIAIVSAITNRNREFFKTIEEEIKEKGKIVKAILSDGMVVFNGDDKNVMTLAPLVKSSLVTFGFFETQSILAESFKLAQTDDPQHETDEQVRGVMFKAKYNGSTVPVILPGVIGADHVRAAMASMLVGQFLGLSLLEMVEGFKQYEGAKGRMQLVKGIKKTMIVDDTFDANPHSVTVALETLAAVTVEQPREKFAIIGEMNHLGRYTEEEHKAIGERVVYATPDYLCVVGEKARDIMRQARASGMPEDRCFYFASVEQAGKFIQNRLEKGDLMLVTGARELRMERIVKELMAEPLEYKMKLVRADKF